MHSEDLLNLKVKHKIFGTGVITGVSNNYLTIKFAARESKFVYPYAFEKFIVADDTSIQSEIMEEINNIKIAAEAQLQAAEKAYKTEDERRKVERRAVSTIRNRRNIEDGFGRGINRTPSTVVLISLVYKKKSGFVYHDHWTSDGDYIYSGEGKTGDQQMTLGNKAIVDAERDGKPIHLFVKFSPQEYYY